MRFKTRPLLHAENYNRDFAPRKILLIAHVLVGGEKHIEAVGFCGHEQFAVFEPVPALLSGCTNLVSFEMGANRYRRRLVNRTRIGEPRERGQVPCRDCGQQTQSRL